MIATHGELERRFLQMKKAMSNSLRSACACCQLLRTHVFKSQARARTQPPWSWHLTKRCSKQQGVRRGSRYESAAQFLWGSRWPTNQTTLLPMCCADAQASPRSSDSTNAEHSLGCRRDGCPVGKRAICGSRPSPDCEPTTTRRGQTAQPEERKPAPLGAGIRCSTFGLCCWQSEHRRHSPPIWERQGYGIFLHYRPLDRKRPSLVGSAKQN